MKCISFSFFSKCNTPLVELFHIQFQDMNSSSKTETHTHSHIDLHGKPCWSSGHLDIAYYFRNPIGTRERLNLGFDDIGCDMLTLSRAPPSPALAPAGSAEAIGERSKLTLAGELTRFSSSLLHSLFLSLAKAAQRQSTFT